MFCWVFTSPFCLHVVKVWGKTTLFLPHKKQCWFKQVCDHGQTWFEQFCLQSISFNTCYPKTAHPVLFQNNNVQTVGLKTECICMLLNFLCGEQANRPYKTCSQNSRCLSCWLNLFVRTASIWNTCPKKQTNNTWLNPFLRTASIWNTCPYRPTNTTWLNPFLSTASIWNSCPNQLPNTTWLNPFFRSVSIWSICPNTATNTTWLNPFLRTVSIWNICSGTESSLQPLHPLQPYR